MLNNVQLLLKIRNVHTTIAQIAVLNSDYDPGRGTFLPEGLTFCVF